MKISIGCDHSALELKDSVIAHLKELGHLILRLLFVQLHYLETVWGATCITFSFVMTTKIS